MQELQPATGPQRIEQFVVEAKRYAARLPNTWD
jgi:hypothetical protein